MKTTDGKFSEYLNKDIEKIHRDADFDVLPAAARILEEHAEKKKSKKNGTDDDLLSDEIRFPGNDTIYYCSDEMYGYWGG